MLLRNNIEAKVVNLFFLNVSLITGESEGNPIVGFSPWQLSFTLNSHSLFFANRVRQQ